MEKHLIGIEFGGTKLQIVLGAAGGRIVGRQRFQVDPARGAAGLQRQIESELPRLCQDQSIAAIGVGFGGPVDWRRGAICKSHQIEGWSGFRMGEWLNQRWRAPVAVENDANTAALAEARLGAGRGFDPVFYITLGSGVGGGLAVQGEIYHGAIPGEAEIGHVRLDRAGAVVEQRCSGWAVDRRMREQAVAHPESQLARLIAGRAGGEARFLKEACLAGDPFAQEIFSQLADDLAFALSHVTQLFHPAIIVLGGGLSLLGEFLRGALAARLKRFIMEVFQPGPEVALAELAEDAVPVGALLLAERACGGQQTQT